MGAESEADAELLLALADGIGQDYAEPLRSRGFLSMFCIRPGRTIWQLSFWRHQYFCW